MVWSFTIFLATTLTSPVSTRFLGFSPDQELAAYRTPVSLPTEDGGADRFQLTTVVDVRDGSERRFRSAKIVHVGPRGLSRALGAAEAAARYPDIVALPTDATFKRLFGRTRFSARRLELDQGVLRLQREGGAALTGSVAKEELTIRGTEPGPLSFTAIARRWDGVTVGAGTFHCAAAAPRETMRAVVHAYYSKRGESIATVVTCLAPDGGASHQVVTTRMPRGVPVATTLLGTVRTGSLLEGQVAGIFGQLHPDLGRSTYQHLVGGF